MTGRQSKFRKSIYNFWRENSNSIFRFEWIRTNVILGESEVEIRWFVPDTQAPGIYRITHFGNQKDLLKGTILPYSGSTNEFEVKY